MNCCRKRSEDKPMCWIDWLLPVILSIVFPPSFPVFYFLFICLAVIEFFLQRELDLIKIQNKYIIKKYEESLLAYRISACRIWLHYKDNYNGFLYEC